MRLPTKGERDARGNPNSWETRGVKRDAKDPLTPDALRLTAPAPDG